MTPTAVRLLGTVVSLSLLTTIASGCSGGGGDKPEPDEPEGEGWTVPGAVGAAEGAANASLDDAVSMSTDASNSCQGAQFTIYLAASQ